MSMAEHRRYRDEHQDDPYAPHGSGDAARSQHNDPLAELARLIGQNDPFAEFSRAGARAAPAEEPQAPAPQWLNRGAAADESAGPVAHDPYAAPHDPAAYHGTAHDRGGYQRGDYRDDYRDDVSAAAAPQDPRTAPNVPHDAYGHAAYDAQGYDAQGYPQDDPRYAAVDPYRMDYDDAYQAAPSELPADAYYAEDAAAGAGDAAPLERRRSGMVTIAAVVGLALIGTAGAFGYRAFMGGPAASGEPPVIKADPTPSKVTPAKTADAQPNKLIYDRVGEPALGERVVPREEQPVEVKPVQPVRSIPMAPGAAGTAMVGAPASGFPPSVNEPKKVRTMPIRPDQPAGAPAAAQAPQPLPPPMPAARPGPAAPAGLAAVEPPVRAPAPQPRRNDGPMAIAPQAAPPPARSAAIPARAATGGYVVQVSSQKTEADAQASYRALQARYSRVLTGRDPMIRRVDLGDKGIYYRAQVGPFATADQANALCSELKSAGGACIVQRN